MKASITFCLTIVLLSLALTANAQSPAAAALSKPIAAGEMSPDFTLEDQDKTQVTLSAARGKAPVVLVFYRGYW